MNDYYASEIKIRHVVFIVQLQYSAFTHWRQCACVHFLSAICDNKQELLDTVAKHRFV